MKPAEIKQAKMETRSQINQLYTQINSVKTVPPRIVDGSIQDVQAWKAAV